MCDEAEATVEDLDISHMYLEESDKYFNTVIGHVENIIMDEKFLELHTSFMEEYWNIFDNSEENKLIYYEIFCKYNETIEKYIEEELSRNIQDFKMSDFEEELKNRQTDLDGEIFEMLLTFSDFLAFKEMFMDYKAMKEGHMVDFSQDFLVSKYMVELETEL